MTLQGKYFEGASARVRPVQKFLEGFRYQPQLISRADEDALLAHVRELPFRDFEFYGYTGKQRVVSFGRHYDFTGCLLQKAEDTLRRLEELKEFMQQRLKI
jgi:hypothetical protein